MENLLESSNIQDIYTLSPMQEGMYFHAVSGDDTTAYFEQVSYRLKGEMDPKLVEKSLDLLYKRHQILRTVFSQKKKDKLFQIVLKESKVDFTVEDISDLKPEEQEAWLKAFKSEDRTRPFDLQKDVLMRIVFVRLGDQSFEFIWSYHHILMDGWCVGILIQDFYSIYHSLKEKQTPVLPKVTPYKRYIEYLVAKDQSLSEDYWKNYLSGYDTKTSFPQLTTSDVEAYTPDEFEITIDGQVKTEIDTLIKEHKTTLSTFLQACWGVLLSKYHQTGDVVFGAVVSGRPPEIRNVESIIGLFINTIPIRVQYDKEDTFSTLLGACQEAALEGLEHHHFPLAKLQSNHPLSQNLFDNLMIVENYPLAEKIAEATTQSPAAIQVTSVDRFEQTNYGLNVIISSVADLHVTFAYDSNTYTPDTVKRIAEQFRTLIHQVVDHANVPLHRLSVLPKAEIDHLSKKIQPKPVTYSEKSLVTLFEEQVVQQKEEVALVSDELVLSYQQLDEKSNQLAHLLHSEYGIGAGDRVALSMQRSHYSIVGLLAILKAGAIYLPIDVNQPLERRNQIITDSQASLLLTSAELQDLSSVSIPTFNLRERWSELEGHQTKALLTHYDATRPMYIIYTSGSTGVPKGVLLKDQSLVDRILDHNAHLGFTDQDCMMHMASIGFDASLVEIFMTLLAGAQLIIAAEEVKTNADRLLALLSDHQVSTAILPPAYLKILDRNPLESLNKIISTGEAALLEESVFYAQNKDFYNGYGPTETCIGASFHKVNPEKLSAYKAGLGIPIGRPFANTSIHILDDNGNLLPKGATGEICIGGVGLAMGYLNRPDLTEETFFKNPELSSSRLYRSGDLGRWNEADELEFLGRKDEQFQIRGIRVEPQEIERKLESYPMIDRAVVTLLQQTNHTSVLVAYCTGQDSLNSSELRLFLGNLLPEYMIPAHYVFIDELPINANGKVDYKLLPDVELAVDELFVKPETDTEILIAEIWEQVLGKRPVGLQDNFFELGGDSIKAIQIATRVQKSGIKLDIKQLFKNPTIDLLIPNLHLNEAMGEEEDVHGDSGLTPIQLEFFELPFNNHQHFNQSILLKVPEQLDEQKLQQLFTELINHHDVLRASFPDNATLRILEKDQPLHWVSEDFSNLEKPEEELEAALNQVQRSMELETGPLMRFGLFKMADHSKLLIACHHLVVDGLSWRILMEDIGLLFDQAINDQDLMLPPKTDSYLKWADFLADHVTSNMFEKELEYWKKALNAKTASITDKQKDTDETHWKGLQFGLSKSETETLLYQANVPYGTHINDLLITALVAALHDVYEENDFSIALESHGRESFDDEVNVARTVGWFTSIYPVVLSMADGHRLDAQIKHVKEVLHQVPSYGVGYGMFKYLVPNEWQQAIQQDQKPDILFNYLGQFDQDIHQSGLELLDESRGDEQGQGEYRPYHMTLTGMVSEGELLMNIIYNESLFDNDKVDELQGVFKQHLEKVIAHCANENGRHFTPSDFGQSEISISQLDQVVAKYPNLEDIFPLAPMQEGIHYHIISDASSRAYFEQISYQIRDHIDPELVEKSLRRLTKRHGVLRTAFTGENLDRTYQVVLKERHPEFVYHDIEGIDDQENQIEEYQDDDKRRAFDLENDPLIRVAVFKKGPKDFEFVWSTNHILMDGWCADLIIKEYVTIYRALEANRAPVLEKTKNYRTYIDWLEKLDKEENERYWKDYLSGYSQKMRFPRINAGFTYAPPKTYEFKLDPLLSQKIKEFIGHNQVTLNSLLSSVWGVLLAKYHNTRDVAFGLVVSGRPPEIKGVESMVGLFINTIPLRIRYESDTTYADLVKMIQEDFNEGSAHHYTPLNRVQSNSLMKQDLIDHIFVSENYHTASAAKNESDSGLIDSKRVEQTNYDLNVNVFSQEEIIISFEYNSLVYGESLIERLSKHYHALIEQLLTKPTYPIDQIEILDTLEISELTDDLVGSNEIVDANEKDTHVLALFENQVQKHPNATAITYGDTSITYQQLHEKAQLVAQSLLQDGLTLGSLVLVDFGYSIDNVIATLGVFMAGGVCVPIDPSLSREQLDYIVSETRASFVISTKETGNRFFSFDVLTVLVVDELMQKMHSISENACIKINSTLTACINYYFEPNKAPKAVSFDHGNLAEGVRSAQSFIMLKQGDVVLFQNLSLSEKITHEFLWTLTAGATQVIPFEADSQRLIDEDHTNEPKYLLDLIQKEQVTTAMFSPNTLHEFLKQKKISETKIGSLKNIISTGDLQLSTVDLFYQKLENARLSSALRLPEVSMFAIAFSIPKDTTSLFVIPVGTPVTRMQAHILDHTGKHLPYGMIGELYLEGNAVTKTYFNDANLSEERFLEMSFNDDKSHKLYRTCLLACWNDAGKIELHGSIDDRVAINGNSFHLFEVEAVMNDLPEIAQSTIVAVSNESDKGQLVAYIVEDSEVSNEDLQSLLKEKLPEHLIPSQFVRQAELPLNVLGKVDKLALQELNTEEVDQQYEAPQNEIQQNLVEILEKLLKVEKIGIRDNFFQLGADSIVMLQLMSRAKRVGYKILPRDPFEYPTVAELSLRMEDEFQKTVSEQGMLTGLSNMLPSQHEFFRKTFDGMSHYNQSMIFGVPKSVSADNLKNAAELLLSQHDALRFKYEQTSVGRWIQNYGEVNEAFAVVSLANEKSEDLSKAITTVCNQFHQSLSLEAGQVIKVVLIETPDEEEMNRLFIVAHHLVVDGVSWRIIIEDLENWLDSLSNGESAVISSKTTSFRQWVEMLGGYAVQVGTLDQFTLWDRILENYVPIPVDHHVETCTVGDIKIISYGLAKDLTDMLLQEINQAYQTEVKDLLLATLAQTMNDWSGANSLVVGIEGHGREAIADNVDLSRTIGWFTTMFPLLLETASGTDVGKLITDIKESIGRIPDNGIGFGALKYFHPDEEVRQKLSSTQWDVVFNYLGQVDNTTTASKWFLPVSDHVGNNASKNKPVHTKLTINSFIADGQLILNWSYGKEIYSADTIHRIAKQYIQDLKSLILHCKAMLSGELEPTVFADDNVEMEAVGELINEESEDLFKF